MSDAMIPANQREFRCAHCDGRILIPHYILPTTGPCPHCGGVITSPAYEAQVTPLTPFPIPRLPIATPPPSTPLAPAIIEVKSSPPPPPPPEVPATPHPLAKIEKPKVELSTPTKVREIKGSRQQKPCTEGKSERSGLIPALLVLLLLGLIGGGIAYLAYKELHKQVEPLAVKITAGDPAVNEANYIRIGWQRDAYQLLSGYIAATDIQGKIPFILNGERLAPKIEEFYGGSVIVDSDTPAEAFSISELSEDDRKRGLFRMIYDQPPQFDMKEFFRPLASLEVQYGVDEADLLLSTLARAGNFAMEPLQAHAFFKRTPGGLKLDWEIFVQTKYRTLQSFAELPEIGQSGVFRVFIVEDVPEKGKAVTGTRTYQIADPANTGDTARINVEVDSEAGRALSPINWRGTKENRPISRTATVELNWGGETASPELEISRFICWEFLGLGGQETPYNPTAN